MSARVRADVVLPFKLARQGAPWRGRLPLAAFSRLGRLVTDAGAAVDVELDFFVDDDGRTRMVGRASTRLGIECGRCLLPQVRDYVVPLDLCIVASDDAAAALVGGVEPFVLETEETTVVDLLEDDMLLALPGQVCELPETCPNRPPLDYPGDGEARTEPGRSPFAALSELKRQ
jgi:uncharacterized protein